MEFQATDYLRSLVVLGFLHLAVALITADRLLFGTISLFTLAYAAYYIVWVAHRPDIYCAGPQIELFLRKHCSFMFSTFYPTFWTIGGLARSIVRCAFQRPPSIKLSRKTLTGADGGLFCIDWVERAGAVGEKNHKKIVVIIPGITGGSEEFYAQHIAAAALEKGCSCLILTQRGNQDTPLTTPRTYCATCFKDVETIQKYLAENYPLARIFLVGISLGALQITHYLGNLGSTALEKRLAGAMTISMPYKLFISKESIEKAPCHFTAGTYLRYKLKKLFRRHRKIFEENKSDFDLNYGLKARTLTEIDERIICPMYGYSSWEEYYRKACPIPSLKKIRIPYLALNADDDPFSPGSAIPVDNFKDNSFLVLIRTKVGGHIGFTENTVPTGATLTEKVLAQFANACFMKNTQEIFS